MVIVSLGTISRRAVSLKWKVGEGGKCTGRGWILFGCKGNLIFRGRNSSRLSTQGNYRSYENGKSTLPPSLKPKFLSPRLAFRSSFLSAAGAGYYFARATSLALTPPPPKHLLLIYAPITHKLVDIHHRSPFRRRSLDIQQILPFRQRTMSNRTLQLLMPTSPNQEIPASTQP